MQTQPHTSLAAVIVLAVLAVFAAAPAAFADSSAPAFPRAVPTHVGALTGPDGSSDAARAQERYYSSYGTPAPLTQSSAPADGGVDWTAIGIAIAGACLLAGVPAALLMRTRRRTGRAHAAA